MLALIKTQPIRWDVWSTVFLSLTLMKKEKLEEIEDVLMLMYFEFCEQLQEAECKDVLKVSSTFAHSPKLLSYINGCKVKFDLRLFFLNTNKNVFIALVRCILNNCNYYQNRVNLP